MGIETAQILFLLLLFSVVVFATIARRLKTAYPIVLVIGGLLLGFVPGIPLIPLDPDLVFLVFLPPLLYGAAWNTSWRDFRYNLISIALLAVGLVAFTVAAVAIIAPVIFPQFDWRTGLVLGAVVSTTDAVAATSIARRVGLPKRIVDILEGESLVNDATGLLALHFGVGIVVHGKVPTIFSGSAQFIYLSFAGILAGLAIARVVEWFERQIDDGPIEIAVSIFVPYSAYLAAELIHASGVLAVVAAGLYLGRRSSRIFSPSVRLQANAVWNALVFIVNGLVFLLIGLQLPYVLGEIRDFERSRLWMDAAVFSIFLILLRLAWTFPGARLAYVANRVLMKHEGPPPGVRLTFVLGWTGMRGVIALAAAISLPVTLSTGGPFPQRSLIIFLTFSVILVTLVGQGLSLPPLIRALGLAGRSSLRCDEREAQRLMSEAALAFLDENRDKDDPAFAGIYDDLIRHYRQNLASAERTNGSGDANTPDDHQRYLEVAREVLGVERQRAMDLQREGRISYEALRDLEQKLDLSSARLTRELAP